MKVAGLSFVALFVLVLGAIAFDGRHDGNSPQPTPTPVAQSNQVTIEQDGNRATVTVEIAATFSQREIGLMNRQELPEDSGMLFLFPGDVQYGFWMKNTYIPLDIAYIDSSGTVVQIMAGKPLDDKTVLVPSKQYRYVLEVNQGWFERHSLGAGAQVTLPKDLPPAQ